jgi:hypothetical protein
LAFHVDRDAASTDKTLIGATLEHIGQTAAGVDIPESAILLQIPALNQDEYPCLEVHPVLQQKATHIHARSPMTWMYCNPDWRSTEFPQSP